MEKDYQSSGAASLRLGQKIIWDPIHSRTAFVFVQNPAGLRLFLLEIRCATKFVLKNAPAFNVWVLVGLFLVAVQCKLSEGNQADLNAECMHSNRSRAIQHKDAKCPFTAPVEPPPPGPCTWWSHCLL